MSETGKARDFLVALQRLEFEKAAKQDRTQLIIQLVIAIVAAGSQFVRGEILDLGTALVLVILVGTTFWLMHRSWRQRAVGERARRATLLVDGLGLTLSAAELRRMAASSSVGPQEVEAWKEPGYFTATEPPGVQRAAAMLQESAFWSAHLFRASAARMQIWLVGCGIAALVCLLAGPTLWPGAAHRVLVPVFSVLASSLVFIEWLIRVMRYHAAANETDEILQRLESLRVAGFPHDDFLLILVDYNSVVEAAPMMAPGVYKANHARLDRIWREQYGA